MKDSQRQKSEGDVNRTHGVKESWSMKRRNRKVGEGSQREGLLRSSFEKGTAIDYYYGPQKDMEDERHHKKRNNNNRNLRKKGMVGSGEPRRECGTMLGNGSKGWGCEKKNIKIREEAGADRGKQAEEPRTGNRQENSGGEGHSVIRWTETGENPGRNGSGRG